MTATHGRIGFFLFVGKEQMTGCGPDYRVNLCIDLLDPFPEFTWIILCLHLQLYPLWAIELRLGFFPNLLIGDPFQGV